jgi:hypothetical protein
VDEVQKVGGGHSIKARGDHSDTCAISLAIIVSHGDGINLAFIDSQGP